MPETLYGGTMNTLSIFRRTVIGMLGLTLAMTSVVLIAPSASAATVQVPTWIKLQTIAPTPVGGTQQIQGQVIGTLGGDQGYVDVGTVTVLRQLSGEPGMTTIGSTPVGSTFSLSVPAVRNATYQVVYSGGTESSFGNLYKYSPSSTVAQGPVTRAVGLRFPARFRGSARIRIAVSPSYAKRFVTVQKDPSCTSAWRPAGRVKTNKYGVAVKKLRVPRGQICLNFVVPGDANYAQSADAVRGWRA